MSIRCEHMHNTNQLRSLTLVVGLGEGGSVGGGVDTVGEVVGLGCYRV